MKHKVARYKTTVLVLSLIALAAAPSQAAQEIKARDSGASLEQTCRELVGKEQPESQGRGGVGRLQAQRFGECMMGAPH